MDEGTTMGYEVPKTSTTTSADGILTQANAVDLLSHWQETLESELGFSLDSLFNVQLYNDLNVFDVVAFNDRFIPNTARFTQAVIHLCNGSDIVLTRYMNGI